MDFLRSLKSRPYRVYFAGQFVSLTGTWMQNTAQAWLLFRLSGSAAWLGAAGFLGQAPTLLFGLLGGAAADRYGRRRILLWTQSLFLLQAAVLWKLSAAGLAKPWHILALALWLGVLNAFDMPARQVLYSSLVPVEHMGNAIALNSFLVNLTRMIGPALAGLLIDASGESSCFLANALSYGVVLASLWTLPRDPDWAGSQGALESIREGLRYAAAHAPIRRLLLRLAVVSSAAMPALTLLPVFAERVLARGSRGLGFLFSALGAGALVGALALARRKSDTGLHAWVRLSPIAFGVCLAAFALSGSYALSLALMVPTGLFMMSAFAGANMLLQGHSKEEMRGRVMSLFAMTFMGLGPLASLLAGALAERWGAPAVTAASGLLCSLLALSLDARREDDA